MNLKYLSAFGMLIALLSVSTGCRDHHRDVVVIEKTGSYHTDKCPRVNMANTEIMPIDQAEALHMKPCPNCKPNLKIK